MMATRQKECVTRVAKDLGAPDSDAPGRHVSIQEYCRLALSRRKLEFQRCGTRARLVDEATGEHFWIEESKLWNL